MKTGMLKGPLSRLKGLSFATLGLSAALLLTMETGQSSIYVNGIKSHDSEPASTWQPGDPGYEEKIAKINARYQKEIVPIFKVACYDCHTNDTHYPFYYSFPPIKSMMDYDIIEGKRHLWLTDEFPFDPRHTPYYDLDEIELSIIRKTAPPVKYMALHWDAILSDAEKQNILDWAREGKKLLEKFPGAASSTKVSH